MVVPVLALHVSKIIKNNLKTENSESYADPILNYPYKTKNYPK